MTDPAYEAVRRARNQEGSGNPSGAAETLERYLETDPHNTRARMELARICAYPLGDLDRGNFQIDIVLDLEPGNVEALKASATIKAKERRRVAEAAEQFARLIEVISPRGDPVEYSEVCAAYAVFLRRQMTDFPKAAEYYEKAIAASPSRYEFHQDYAVLLLNDLKDYVRAKRELEDAMRLNPGDKRTEEAYRRLLRQKFDSEGNLKRRLSVRLRRRGGP